MPHHGDFKLSITKALADQLADRLTELQPTPLTVEAIDELAARPGVYELFLGGERVYVGKASKSLPSRLRNHLRKLSGRTNISGNDVSFCCLYVDEDLEAAAPEKMLIAKYRPNGLVAWNTNGFGNKDPGKNRDRSLVKANHFDAEYPINLQLDIDLDLIGRTTLDVYLKTLKTALPYNLRYENKDPAATAIYLGIEMDVPITPAPAGALIQSAVAHLPVGWQATIFPGYVILYPRLAVYNSALKTWQASDGGAVETVGLARTDAPGDVEDVDVDTDD